MKRVELLAPAGSYDAFISAINNGANAIYLAGKNFNARNFVKNFSITEIKEMIKYAHLRDVSIYVTVNTLIKDSEINEVLNFVCELYKSGVDAILVQDLGLIDILHKAIPNLVLHASTQMNCTCLEDAIKLKNLGIKRIVLARECSLKEIKRIKENLDIELEVFCHGALCMSYSGNCLMSSLIGGRSGNRGKCAQSCRQEYELEFDNGLEKEIINKKYYLSMKDLMTLPHLFDLIDAGVDSLKIEGRSKESEYVAITTKWYKKKIDDYYNKTKNVNNDISLKELKSVYNRSFTKGYILNEDNNLISNIDTVNHLGIEIGNVIKKENKNIYIKLNDELNIDDCIRIVRRNNQTYDETIDAIIVNNMYKINKNNSINLVKTASTGDTIKLFSHLNEAKIKNINELVVLKTKDKKLIDSIKDINDKKIMIEGIVKEEDYYLSLILKYKDIEVEARSSELCELANNENMKDRIISQISKISDTEYCFEKLTYIGRVLFLPIKEINELRRKAIELLSEKIDERFKEEYKNRKDIYKYYSKANIIAKSNDKLIVKVSRLEQAMACVDCDIKYIITENEELYSELKKREINVYYMNPRLSGKDIIVNIDGEIISSVYNNVMNIYSINHLIESGVNVVGLSPELSGEEIKEMIDSFKAKFKFMPKLMMMVYGRYEMMIMKHCVINKAYGYKNKGCLECMKHQYYLKDKKDYEFPLVRTIDCNMKVLNSRITSLIDNIENIRKMGINNILLDFVIENYKETVDVINNYKNCFDKNINGKEYNSLTTHGAYVTGVE